MKIGALTTWFNEEAIAPYFLRHYEDWDEVRVLLDTATSDRTAEICARFDNAGLFSCSMKAGLNELEKVALLQDAFQDMVKAGFDWIAVLDSDEFVIPEWRGMTAHGFLRRMPREVDAVKSAMFPVYRHHLDLDLNPAEEPLPQRLHGLAPKWNEVKPNVLRADPRAQLSIGMHTVPEGVEIARPIFVGTHWADADPSLTVRRLNRKARFSKQNLEMKWGEQHFNVTEEGLKKELAGKQNCPFLWGLAELAGVSV